MNMDKFELLHSLIRERRVAPGAYYFPDPWWEREIEAMVADIPAAIEFIKTQCSDEELYWLTEVIDDVVEKTQSTAFIDSLRERTRTVNNAERRKEILDEIRSAEEYIR